MTNNTPTNESQSTLNEYSTHLPVLNLMLQCARIESAWEFGMGFYSTPFLVEHCKLVISAEMQSLNWYHRVRTTIRSKVFQAIYLPGPWLACIVLFLLPRKFDLILVDGHGDSRFTAANVAMKKSDLVVLHDTETASYRWERIRRTANFCWIDFTLYRPWTSVLVRDWSVAQRLMHRGEELLPIMRHSRSSDNYEDGVTRKIR